MKRFLPLNTIAAALCRMVVALCAVLVLGGFEASASEPQQTKESTITLRLNSVSLVQLFEAIEQQSDYSFIWDEKLRTKLQHRVSVETTDVPLEQLLSSKLSGTGLTFKIIEKQVVIKQVVQTQTATTTTAKNVVSGTVISSADNKPLLGVSVYIEGTTVGTLTDDQGRYSLELPAGTKAVNFSFLGYEDKAIPTAEPLLFSLVTLIEQNTTMDEVVVVGFGRQKKESLVGSISTIAPSKLKMTSSNLSSSFIGKVAGIVSVQSSGEPGADGSSFWIRGISTFGSNKESLIILDGVEIDKTILNSIAPETIEQFSILKDATSTALYGSRGANGVMLVTTKSGANSEKMAINVRVENGWSMPTRITPVADGVTFMENYNEARRMRGMAEHFSYEKIENTKLGTNDIIYPNNNWYEMLFKDFSMNQNINANIRGGSKKIDYFLNASVHNEDGMLRNTKMSNYKTNENMQKYTFQSNISSSVTNTTKVALKMTTQLMYRKGTSAVANDLFAYTMHVNPVDFPAYFPAQEGDEHVRYGNAPGWDGGAAQTNPLAILNRGYCNKYWGNVLATFTIDQDLKFITEGLKLSGLASFKNYTYSNTWNQLNPYYYNLTDYWMGADGNYVYDMMEIGTTGTNYLTPGVSNSGNRIFNFQVTADYARTFGRHDVAATLVYHQRETLNNVPSAEQNAILPYREQGLAGRVTYGFDSRYLFEANFGYNGSENFHAKNRWGFFPSVAVGWVISNEPFFFKAKEVVSLLKLRASYGLVGNDALPMRFAYLTLVNMNSTDNEFKGFFGGDSFKIYNGIQITRWGNEDASWEVSRKLNVGLEIGLFNDLTIMADFFHEQRNDIFMLRRSIPASSGFQESTPYANIGAVLNRGVDMSLEYNKAVNKDLIISVQGTFTYAHNEVTAKDEPHYEYGYQKLVGKPINSVYGYVADGLFKDQADIDNSAKQEFGAIVRPGDIKYKDLNGDGVIDGNDQTSLGYPTIPEITYGLGASIQWKNFDFSFFFQGVTNVAIEMKNHHPFVTNQYSGYNMQQWIADDHWTEENQNVKAAYPRLSYAWNTNNTQTSSFWLKDGSYLRLKNLEFGYTIKSFRVYASATNVFTLSPFKYWDPELGSGNGLAYPLQRQVKLGLQYNF